MPRSRCRLPGAGALPLPLSQVSLPLLKRQDGRLLRKAWLAGLCAACTALLVSVLARTHISSCL